MSIEKLDFDQVIREQIGFTIILNEIILHIKNSDAYMVWSYLFSHSANWDVIKTHLKTKFSIGDTKLKKIFSYLHRAGLVEYFQPNNGKFSKQSIRILCGSRFLKDEPFLPKKPGGSIPNPTGKSVDNSGGSISARTGFRTSGSGALRKERSSPKEKKAPKERKSSCETLKKKNAERHPFAASKNEKASIERSNGFKKLAASAEFKETFKQVLAKVKL